MLGGAVWCLGNVLCVPIIQRISLGLGLLVWGSTALFTGWITGYFGLFGLNEDRPHDLGLNLVGLGFASASLLASLMVKPETGGTKEQEKGPPLTGDSNLDALYENLNDDTGAAGIDSTAQRKDQILGSTKASADVHEKLLKTLLDLLRTVYSVEAVR